MEKDYEAFFGEDGTGNPPREDALSEGFLPAEDNAYADEFAQEYAPVIDGEEPNPDSGIEKWTGEEEEPPKPKKKKTSFKKKVRRFLRKGSKLPTKTLIIFGGGIAILLIAVILITILLSKGCSAKTAADATAAGTPVPAISASPDTESDDGNTEDDAEDAEDTEFASSGTHPLEGLGTQGSNGWYLKLNDDYPVIAEIQERLHELGYMEIPVVDDKEGYTTKYGPSTKAAVRAFQDVNGLEIDGMLGQSTYDLLMSDAAKPLQFSNSSRDSVFETYIEKLQTRLISLHYLSGEPTKKFEDKTTQALKQFQAKNGLTADGIAGPKTLEVLYSSSALDATSSITATAIPVATATPTTDTEE